MTASPVRTATAEEAAVRLRRALFALRTNRWWEARQILHEARACEDWKLLGHESWDEYLAGALGKHVRAL